MKNSEALFHARALVTTGDRPELVGEADTSANDHCYLVDFSTAQSWDLFVNRLDDENWALILGCDS